MIFERNQLKSKTLYSNPKVVAQVDLMRALIPALISK
jgi:hypothetical protein